MANKRRGSKRVPRRRSPLWATRSTVIGLFVGLVALGIDIFVVAPRPPWLQNIINWSVGIGLVGGGITLIALLVNRVYGRKKYA